MKIPVYIPTWGDTTGMFPVALLGFTVVGLNGVDLAKHRELGVIQEIPVTSDLWRAVVNNSNALLEAS